MYDEAKDRTPFDVSTLIEGEVQALVDSRTRPIPPSPLRRRSPPTDSIDAAPGPEDRPALEEQPSPASAALARAPLLVERQTTHGNFEDNAIVSQAIKDLLRAGPGWLKLSAIERESMDMIALKFSRILSGKSMEKQHWEDVVGYAKLVEEKCF